MDVLPAQAITSFNITWLTEWMDSPISFALVLHHMIHSQNNTMIFLRRFKPLIQVHASRFQVSGLPVTTSRSAGVPGVCTLAALAGAALGAAAGLASLRY
jgi:hypothetical protein